MPRFQSQQSGSSLEGGETLKMFLRLMRDEWNGTAVDGRRYVRTKRMTDWMKANESIDKIANGGLLLDDVYDTANKPHAPRGMSEFPSVKWEQISDEGYIVVFGLLTFLGHGHFINEFRQHRVSDHWLQAPTTIRENMLNDHFRSSQGLQTFIDDFDRHKWEFWPVEFSLDLDLVLSSRHCILPFCHKDPINSKGATAQLFEVAVEEDFVEESLRSVIKGSRYDDSEFGPCYRFAFKSYSQGREDIYKIEKNAFKGIGNEQDMIKCLGTVETSNAPGGDPQDRCYNILLEYGEDDLNEYFIVHSPPTLSSEILDFWEKLFQIADALQRVHNLEKKRNNGNSVMFKGCHADVKPDNILRVQGKFKLADFGFATFVPHNEESISPVGGTETYGAPEFFQMACQPSENGTVSNRLDTWSFACVISVAVTWAVLGLQGMIQYQSVRKAAVQKIKSKPRAAITHRLNDDVFHDGSAVLGDVINWHKYLRQVMRKSDPISDRLLDLIDEVLSSDPDSRLTSAELYEKLTELLLEAKKKIYEPVADSILESMISFDKTGPSTMGEFKQQWENSITRKNGNSKHPKKSARLTNIVPAKVAHRQVLEDTLSQSSLINGYSERDHSISANSSSIDLARTNSVIQPQAHATRALTPLRTSTTRSMADVPIVQAYSSMLEGKLRRWPSLTRPKKDKYLSNFIKDRDIKFIVDNGSSMKKHWDHATQTLLVLAEKVAACDDNGVDLEFTFANNELGCQNIKNPRSKFAEAMKQAESRISTDPGKPLATDMARTLGEVFDKYEIGVTKRRTTLIVLTDGVWEGSSQFNEVEEEIEEAEKKAGKKVEKKIASFLKGSRRANGYEDRPFTIQDVIDHEPWTGNLYKMILGSLDQKFDTNPTSAIEEPEDMLAIPLRSPSGILRRLSGRSNREKAV
ncbi:hypothetical protein F4777DRAFT_584828 [Nemania sp. FL0916]|nr:hypothetical protein F4777DRAFT_584828 [Nemania sp. FL0916]